MIHATKPELESIIRDAADGLIALRSERLSLCRQINSAGERRRISERLSRIAMREMHALRAELKQATETEWRLCWWSSLAGCGVTLAGLWLGGLL